MLCYNYRPKEPLEITLKQRNQLNREEKKKTSNQKNPHNIPLLDMQEVIIYVTEYLAIMYYIKLLTA